MKNVNITTNEKIKCQHIVMIVKKAFENVKSLSEIDSARLVYSRIQQSLNKDRIFDEKECYEILEYVSIMIFECSHENYNDINIECLVLCHNLVEGILIKRAQIEFMEYRMKMLQEIDLQTQEIVNPFFGFNGFIRG